MFTQTISSHAVFTPQTLGSQGVGSIGGSFKAEFARARMTQTVQGPLGPQEIDPADESEALRELFHLMACLSVGIIDFEAIGKKKSRSGATPGPMRDRVEGLKRCLREFSSRKRELDEAPIDPATGKPQEGSVQGAAQVSQEPLSLREIYDSLPDEIRNLLRRIFPDLDDKLREDDGAKNPSQAHRR